MAAQFNVQGTNARLLFHDLYSDPALISLWTLSEKSGTVYDRSKTNRLDGTVAGNPVYSSALTNGFYGLNMDGTGDWAAIGDVTALDFERTNSWSILTVIRPNISAFAYIISKWANAGGWRYSLNASSQAHFQLFSPVDSTNLEITSDTALVNGTDYMLLVTYPGDSVAASVAHYVNGVVTAETVVANTLAANIDTANAVRIGAATTGANNFVGIISMTAVFTGAKTAADAKRWAKLGGFI